MAGAKSEYPTGTSSTRPAIDTMTKLEVQKELAELEVSFAKEEVLAVLRAALKKACKERGLTRQGSEQSGPFLTFKQMRDRSWARIFNKYELLNLPVSDEDIMDFGKHKGQSYLGVKQKDPSYCNWVAKETSKNSHPSFLRFRIYLNQPEGGNPEKFILDPTTVTQACAKAAGSKFEPSANVTALAHAVQSSSSNPQMDKMLQLFQALELRVTQLEETRAKAKPISGDF